MSAVHAIHDMTSKREGFLLSLRLKSDSGSETPSRSRRLLLKFSTDKRSRNTSTNTTAVQSSLLAAKSTLCISIIEAARNPRLHPSNHLLRDDLTVSSRLSFGIFNMSRANASEPAFPSNSISRKSNSPVSKRNTNPIAHNDASRVYTNNHAGSVSSSIASLSGMDLAFEYTEDEGTNATETSFENDTRSTKLPKQPALGMDSTDGHGQHTTSRETHTNKVGAFDDNAKTNTKLSRNLYSIEQSPRVPAGLATMLNDADTVKDHRDLKTPRDPLFDSCDFNVLMMLASQFESIRIIENILDAQVRYFDDMDVTDCFTEPYFLD